MDSGWPFSDVNLYEFPERLHRLEQVHAGRADGQLVRMLAQPQPQPVCLFPARRFKVIEVDQGRAMPAELLARAPLAVRG